MRFLLPFLTGLCVMLGTPRAQGCGQSGGEVDPLLPLDEVHDVPLNAVLISSASSTEAIYQVRQVGGIDHGTAGAPGETDSSDAGLAVPTEVTCRHHQRSPQGALCFARAELEPNTTYEWAVASDSKGEGPDDTTVPRWTWRRFTTGDAPAMASPLGEVNVAVTRYELIQDPPCGDWSSGTLTLDGTALNQPVVVSVVEAVPTHNTQALLLEPGTRSEMNLFRVEGCYEVEAFDLLGNRTTLGNACFESDSPVGSSTGGQPGQPTSPEGSTDVDGEPRVLPEPGGCATETPMKGNSLWWVVGGGVVCLVMRRRMAGATRARSTTS